MQAERQSITQDDGCGARWTYSRRGYALSQSLRQLKQFRLATVATLMVLGITLSLPLILFFAYPSLASLSQRSLQGESLTAYLHTTVDDSAGAELASTLVTRADVARSEYISRERALAMLSEVNDVSSAIDILGENPLPGAIVVYPEVASITTGAIELLSQSLEDLPQVSSVQLDLRWVKRLNAAISLIQWVGGALALFLMLSATLVITNTIRLELSRRKSELEVMNLLGAPRHFMNRPVVYTGALYGLLGGIFACAVGLLVFNAMQNPADNLSSLYQSEFALDMPDIAQISVAIFACLVLGLVGTITSLYRPSPQLTQRQ